MILKVGTTICLYNERNKVQGRTKIGTFGAVGQAEEVNKTLIKSSQGKKKKRPPKKRT